MVEKVVQCGHGKVTIIEVDHGERKAPAEGRYEGSKLRIFHPPTLWSPGTAECATFSGRTQRDLRHEANDMFSPVV